MGIVLTFLTLSSPVYAALQNRLENRQEKMELRQENRQEQRQEKRSDVAGKHSERLAQRFSNYQTRFAALIAKIQARIDLSTTKNVTSAQAKLDDAKAKLAYAIITGEKAVAQFKAIDPAKWVEQKAEAQAARDTADQARNAFKDTLALMIESVKLLKSAPAK